MLPARACASPPPDNALVVGGSWVKKPQFSDRTPLTIRYPRMTTSSDIVTNTHAPSTHVITTSAVRADTHGRPGSLCGPAGGGPALDAAARGAAARASSIRAKTLI